MVDALTREELQRYITDQVPEDVHLDYKASGSISREDNKKGEIGKDVSAFANADGGRIIYGIIEDKKTKKPAAFDGIVQSDFNRTWLDQVIRSNTQPPVTTQIREVDLGDGKVAFVVDIPQATGLAPHMATYFKQYFHRSNDRSEAMLHHQIQDVAGRATTPNLSLVESMTHDGGVNDDDIQKVHLSFALINQSATPAFYSRVQVSVPGLISGGTVPHWEGRRLRAKPGDSGVMIYSMNRAVPVALPSYQEDVIHLEPITLKIPTNGLYVFKIDWTVTAPGCRNEGQVRIVSQNRSVFIPEEKKSAGLA